jgi:hypothetical protein
MNRELNAEVRARVDAHLEAVEQVLVATGHTREARRAVVDDLEAQILEMLSQSGAEPTVADVEAVLGRLDAPAAYGEGAKAVGVGTAGVRKPRYSRTAIWGLVCVLVSLVPMGVLGVVMVLGLVWYSASESRHRQMQMEVQVTKPGVDVTVSATQVADPFADGEALPAASMPEPMKLMAPESEATTQAVRQPMVTAWGPLLLVLVVGLPGALLGLLGTILGWVAYGQIKAAQGMLLGRGMALFDGLFYPVLTVVMAGGGLLVVS